MFALKAENHLGESNQTRKKERKRGWINGRMDWKEEKGGKKRTEEGKTIEDG